MKSYVAKELNNAAKIFEERSKIYGMNYHHFGKAMQGFFPHGLELTSEEEFNRLGLFVMMASKLTRYAQNFKKGGHKDSMDDLSVYAQMTNEADQLFKKKGKRK